jgi:peptidase E
MSSELKTTFILYGGFTPNEQHDGNADFSREILKYAPENPIVLLVPFAKESDRVIPTTERTTNELNAQKWQKNIRYEIATEEKFVEQINSADVIYFQGGASHRLLDVLKKYSDLGELLKGKIVAGDSAGANALSTFFYSPSSDEVCEGLGILLIKVIPHYKEEYQYKLDDAGTDLEKVFLPEYTYKVIYKK